MSEARPAWSRGEAVRSLFPGYFAFVMATGIIAIAADQHDLHWLADGLYVVAAAGYVILWVLLVLRIVMYPREFLADLDDHRKGFAFLTAVAATNVLGAGSVVLHGWWTTGWALWWVSLALWTVLLYSTLFAVIMSSEKPTLGEGINGTWFLLTVSTQSVVVLGALLLGNSPHDRLAFLLVAAFTLGIVLYLIVMTMVFLRWTFSLLDPREADPPAWIAAGAVAITVLAGSNLLLDTSQSPRLERLVPFIEGMTVLAWAAATFWFPVMIAIGVWRHLINKVPLRYHPSYWGLVFPIGMYSVATHKMRAAVALDGLQLVTVVALVAAIVAWSVTFVGLAHHLYVRRTLSADVHRIP